MTAESAASQVPVSAIGTARRLQALATLGWSVTSVACAAGVSEDWASSMAHGRLGDQHIEPDAAQAVDRVFRQRCMTTGPSPLARSAAARHGWVSALAWDDIDDPLEQPQGISQPVSALPGPVRSSSGRHFPTMRACSAWLRRASFDELRVYVATGHRPGGTVDLRPAVLRLADATSELHRHTSTRHHRNAA